MKTYKQWEKSNLDIDKYLGEEPCEIDEDIYLHLMEIVPPQYSDGKFGQCGEAMYSEGSYPYKRYYYESVSRIKGKYFYLGVLPEFNNHFND